MTKTELLKLKISKKKIANLELRIEEIYLKNGLCKSPTISDMPKAPTITGNGLEDDIARLDVLEDKLKMLKEERRLLIEMFEEEIKDFKENHKQILRLRYCEGLPNYKIAEICKCNEANVRYAVKKFRPKNRTEKLTQKSHRKIGAESKRKKALKNENLFLM